MKPEPTLTPQEKPERPQHPSAESLHLYDIELAEWRAFPYVLSVPDPLGGATVHYGEEAKRLARELGLI
jgi:hypothetical protein